MDTSYGELKIGGRIPRHAFEAAVRPLLEQYSVDEEDGYITVTDDDAVGGMFEELESVLVDMEIDFDRDTSAHYEWPNSTAIYRRQWGQMIEHQDENDIWLVPVDDIRGRLHNPSELAKWLDANYPVVPELEPITWIEDTPDVDSDLIIAERKGSTSRLGLGQIVLPWEDKADPKIVIRVTAIKESNEEDDPRWSAWIHPEDGDPEAAKRDGMKLDPIDGKRLFPALNQEACL